MKGRRPEVLECPHSLVRSTAANGEQLERPALVVAAEEEARRRMRTRRRAPPEWIGEGVGIWVGLGRRWERGGFMGFGDGKFGVIHLGTGVPDN